MTPLFFWFRKVHQVKTQFVTPHVSCENHQMLAANQNPMLGAFTPTVYSLLHFKLVQITYLNLLISTLHPPHSCVFFLTVKSQCQVVKSNRIPAVIKVSFCLLLKYTWSSYEAICFHPSKGYRDIPRSQFRSTFWGISGIAPIPNWKGLAMIC